MKRVLRHAVAALSLVAASVLALPGGSASASTFPGYDHVFTIMMENQTLSSIIGNPAAPELNALANDYGLATNYTGVGDPSEPNYVGMLGGSTFGLSDDNPYFWPGHTQNAANLMSQLEAAGKSWKGYLGGLPYAGYKGFCYPEKCIGIPDSDPLYASKHNGIVNFANLQTPGELAKMTPIAQLSTDLAAGRSPNLSYIVPDMCHDMHGAPPYCVDSGNGKSIEDTWLTATGDAFVGQTVNQITASSVWSTGNTAIVITFDEGSSATSKTANIVVANHGPRGVKDNTSYNHYNLLASLQQTFGLGCLLNSCGATPMTPLFQITGSTTTPTLPPPYVTPPNGTNSVSPASVIARGTAASLTCAGGWNRVPSPSVGNLDNNLDAVSAASATDAWAVGNYYAATNPAVFATMAQHWDGTRWTEYALPDVGANQNTLYGVSELPSGHTWAVGYYTNANYVDQTLIEHWDGNAWSVVPSPNPGAQRNLLYGVAAISDTDVWAVGQQTDSAGTWHTLTEHWDGTVWSVVPSADPDAGGNLLFGVKAVSGTSVYAVGERSGSGFPDRALIEHWNGSTWSVLASPADSSESLIAYGVTGSDTALTVVGNRASGTAPFTTLAAAGAPNGLALQNTPNATGENNLYATTTAADGSTYAAGWSVDPNTGVYLSEVLHGVNGQWSIDTTPNPGNGSNGFAGVTAVPGDGVWAVGVTSNKANNSTFIAYHC
ncbi:alkaline phosphatase family protein [Solihabitans fulvus]|nr:alkaline phosphatase family protein [Solihabitans fulvus]